MKIISLVGARPQFIKEALLNAKVRETAAWDHILVHSGQHYDCCMSDVFFQELGIPEPAYNMRAGACSHAEATAAVMVGMEKILLREKPDALLVYGDTNTTLGGALAAAKMHVPVIHVEAGIRMLPKDMPEEINRQLTDRISRILCCCSRLAAANLTAEGITDGVHVCGDIMLDVYMRMRHRFDTDAMLRKFSLRANHYIVATIHRDYNVDVPENLKEIITGLNNIREASGLRIVLPLHPRTRKRLAETGMENSIQNLDIAEPLGYLELLSLVRGAAFVITDSGGLQKEAFYAGKRSVVVMPDTGWRELVDSGWNVLAAASAASLLHACETVAGACARPEGCYGDGHTASQIVRCVQAAL